MVLSFPFSYGFGVLCVMGTVISVSSGDWLGVWLGLEINLLGFIPLMVQGVGGQVVESAIKYFVVQALGSGFLLVGGLGGGETSSFWFLGDSFSLIYFFCLVGLVLKLGVAPLHWWVPSVMGGLSWLGCGVLMTWQKLAPFLVLLSLSFSFFWFFVFLGCISSVLGGFMGVGQVQVRILMAYSSISHWGWISGVLAFSLVGSFSYFFFYFFVSIFLFYFLSCGGFWRVGYLSGLSGLFMVLGMLSLSGLPPFSGFVSKWIGMQVVSGACFYFLLAFLVLGSVLSLYYYLSFLFVLFVGGGSGYVSGSGKFLRVSSGVCISFLLFGFPFYECLFYLFY